MLNADPARVTKRAKKRGLPQLGTLGAGNHYAEIQVVDEIYDKASASRMGVEDVGQILVMIHSGSRGLGHQVATDALVEMETAMARDGIHTNDRQLVCARIRSPEGQTYLSGMAAAANYAWVNRSSMTFLARQAFAKVFGSTPDDLDMHVIYDVSHNIAKVETHLVDGVERKLLVHRKGATRAFGPHHPLIPVDYQFTGQPVLIGGTMGTCSFVLTGTEKGMEETFGSTCACCGRHPRPFLLHLARARERSADERAPPHTHTFSPPPPSPAQATARAARPPAPRRGAPCPMRRCWRSCAQRASPSAWPRQSSLRRRRPPATRARRRW